MRITPSGTGPGGQLPAGRGRCEKMENLVSPVGGALLTSWVFLGDSVLGLSSSTRDICTYSLSKSVLCPLVYRPRLSYPSPERKAPSRLSPIPRVQVLKAYLSPSIWRHPQTSISRCLCSTRRLTVATLWLSDQEIRCGPWFQIKLCFLQTQTDFSAVDSTLVGQKESELGPLG